MTTDNILVQSFEQDLSDKVRQTFPDAEVSARLTKDKIIEARVELRLITWFPLSFEILADFVDKRVLAEQVAEAIADKMKKVLKETVATFE